MSALQPQQDFEPSDVAVLEIAQQPGAPRNLIDNSTGEGGAWAWAQNYENADLTGETYTDADGNTAWCLAVRGHQDADGGLGSLGCHAFPVTGGKTYAVRMDVLEATNLTTDGVPGILFLWYFPDGTTSFVSVLTDLSTVGTHFIPAQTAPAGAIRCALLPSLPLNNGTVYRFTNVMATDESDLPAVEVVTSEVGDPKFNNVTTDLTWGTNSGTRITVTSDTTLPPLPGVDYPTLRIDAGTTVNVGLAGSAPMGIPAGAKSLYMSFYARQMGSAPVAGPATELYANWVDASGTVVSEQRLRRVLFPASNAFVLVEGFTTSIPANATAVELICRVTRDNAYRFGMPMAMWDVDYRGRPWFDGDHAPSWAASALWVDADTPQFARASGPTGEFPYAPPAQWVDVMDSVTSIDLTRQGLDVGNMTVTLANPALDPAVSQTIASGRPVRLLVGEEREPVFVGTIENVSAAYDKTNPDPNRQVAISFSSYDRAGILADQTTQTGTADPAALRGIAIAGNTTVPFNVGGVTGHLAGDYAAPISFQSTDRTAILDVVTRFCQSADAGAWQARISRAGVMDVVRPSDIAAEAVTLDGTRIANMEATYDTSQVFNSVTVKASRTVSDGTVEEWTYGPYEDADSIQKYGRRTVELATAAAVGATVTDATWQPLADAFLATNAEAVQRISSFDYVINTAEDLIAACRVDLLTPLTLTDEWIPGTTGQNLQVAALKHSVSGDGWVVTVETKPAGPHAMDASTPTSADSPAVNTNDNATDTLMFGKRVRVAARTTSTSGTIPNNAWAFASGFSDVFSSAGSNVWVTGDEIRARVFTYSGGIVTAMTNLWITLRFTMDWPNNATGRRGMRIIYGDTAAGSAWVAAGDVDGANPSASPFSRQIVYDGPLYAGDTLQMQVYQDTGGTLAWVPRSFTANAEAI